MDVDTEDGRIYLPKRLREQYGDRFDLVDRGDQLVLIPIGEDPLDALREEVRRTENSVTALKKAALDEALADAGRGRLDHLLGSTSRPISSSPRSRTTIGSGSG